MPSMFTAGEEQMDARIVHLHRPMAQKNVMPIGGCCGMCVLPDPDDEEGWRQFLLANCIVLAIALAMLGLVVALL